MPSVPSILSSRDSKGIGLLCLYAPITPVALCVAWGRLEQPVSMPHSQSSPGCRGRKNKPPSKRQTPRASSENGVWEEGEGGGREKGRSGLGAQSNQTKGEQKSKLNSTEQNKNRPGGKRKGRI